MGNVQCSTVIELVNHNLLSIDYSVTLHNGYFITYIIVRSKLHQYFHGHGAKVKPNLQGLNYISIIQLLQCVKRTIPIATMVIGKLRKYNILKAWNNSSQNSNLGKSVESH